MNGMNVGLLPVLLDIALKGLALAALAGGVVFALRRSSAALRHLVWSLAMAGLLAMPLLSALLPRWRVLPRWSSLRAEGAAVTPAPRAVLPAEPEPVLSDALLPMPVGDASPAEPIAAPLPSVPSTPVVAVPAVEPASSGTWTRWIAPAWALLALLLLAPALAGRLALRRLTRDARGVEGGPWGDLLADAMRRLRFRGRVRLLMSDRAVMPMAWGLFRARILLPGDANDWPDGRRRAVLLHELAHIQRRDCLTQLVTHLACALHWFNPLAWLARRRMMTERERACDDLVLACGLRPSDYAEHLVGIAKTLRTRPLAAAAAIPMARPSKLERRLRALLDEGLSRRALTRGLLGLGLAAVVLIVLPLAALRASEPPRPRGYEVAKPSGDDLSIRVGPNRFAVDLVVRRDIDGKLSASDGRGNRSGMSGREAPEAEAGRDSVLVYLKRPVNFDIIESRVFDHATQKSVLEGGRGDAVARRAGPDVVRVAHTGGRLPDTIDLWFRMASYPPDEKPVAMAAKADTSATLGDNTIRLAELKAGRLSSVVNHVANKVTWGKASETERWVTALFELKARWRGERGQVCAVDKDGQPHFAGIPHFFGSHTPILEIVSFPIAKDRLDHFEWRPFGGRQTFFFSGIQLPKADVATDSGRVRQGSRDGAPVELRFVLPDGVREMPKGKFQLRMVSFPLGESMADQRAPRWSLGTSSHEPERRLTYEIPWGRIALLAHVEGFAPALIGPLTHTPGSPYGRIDIPLGRGGKAAVRLRAEDHAPVPNATVTAEIHAINGRRAASLGLVTIDRTAQVTSDAQGGATLPDLPESAVGNLTVSAEGFQHNLFPNVALAAGGAVDLTLRRAVPVTGRVLDAADRPVAGVRLCLLRYAWGGGDRKPDAYYGSFGYSSSSAAVDAWAVTDAAGRFRINRTRGQGWRYWFMAWGPEPAIIGPVEGGNDVGDVRCGTPIAISGHVASSVENPDRIAMNIHQPYLDGAQLLSVHPNREKDATGFAFAADSGCGLRRGPLRLEVYFDEGWSRKKLELRRKAGPYGTVTLHVDPATGQASRLEYETELTDSLTGLRISPDGVTRVAACAFRNAGAMSRAGAVARRWQFSCPKGLALRWSQFGDDQRLAQRHTFSPKGDAGGRIELEATAWTDARGNPRVDVARADGRPVGFRIDALRPRNAGPTPGLSGLPVRGEVSPAAPLLLTAHATTKDVSVVTTIEAVPVGTPASDGLSPDAACGFQLADMSRSGDGGTFRWRITCPEGVGLCETWVDGGPSGNGLNECGLAPRNTAGRRIEIAVKVARDNRGQMAFDISSEGKPEKLGTTVIPNLNGLPLRGDFRITHVARHGEIMREGTPLLRTEWRQGGKVVKTYDLVPRAVAIRSADYTKHPIPLRLVLPEGVEALPKGALRLTFTSLPIDAHGGRVPGPRGGTNLGLYAPELENRITVDWGRVSGLVYMEGFAPVVVMPFTHAYDRKPARIDVRLERGRSVEVRLLAEDGTPVEGAEIGVVYTRIGGHPLLDIDLTQGFRIKTPKSDADGRIAVPDVPGLSRANIRVKADGYEHALFKDVSLEPRHPVTLTLKRTDPAVGRVVDADGKPVPGAEARLFGYEWAGPGELPAGVVSRQVIAPEPLRGWGTANAAGTLRISRMRRGMWRYHFLVFGGEGQEPAAVGPVGAGDDLGTITLGEAISLTGRVDAPHDKQNPLVSIWQQNTAKLMGVSVAKELDRSPAGTTFTAHSAGGLRRGPVTISAYFEGAWESEEPKRVEQPGPNGTVTRFLNPATGVCERLAYHTTLSGSLSGVIITPDGVRMAAGQ